jgi:septal ring factor EnvC (AmiA/AmiB activator)
MQSHWNEEESEEIFSYTPDKIFKELEAETATLQQQRTQLVDQRALLDLEQAELEEHLSALQLKYAILDAHYDRLERMEYALSSEYEGMLMVGNRRF